MNDNNETNKYQFQPVEPYYRHEEGFGKVKVVGQVDFGSGPIEVVHIPEVTEDDR